MLTCPYHSIHLHRIRHLSCLSVVAMVKLADHRLVPTSLVVHFNVTDHPTADWTGQQIIEAFPWDTSLLYLQRDRDGIYGRSFVERVESMGIEQVLSAPKSPWQNPYVERLIGSVRRECLDHVIIFNDRRRILREYVRYYNASRTHLGLECLVGSQSDSTLNRRSFRSRRLSGRVLI